MQEFCPFQIFSSNILFLFPLQWKWCHAFSGQIGKAVGHQESKARALGSSRQFSNTQQCKLCVVETVVQVDVVDQLWHNVHSSGISPITGQHTQKEQVVSQVQLSYHAHTVQQYTVTAFPSLPLNVCVPLQQALITLVYSDELFLLRK